MRVLEFQQPEIKTVTADKIFDLPGRNSRPSHIVIILRGLPGSGKSHIAKLIREKELFHSAPAPRLLSIDSYFLTEVEKTEKDPETGRRVKRRVQEYEYEPEMEQVYRASLMKTYNKTLEEGFFPMVVVDAPNTKVHHFDRYWSNGKMNGFDVYVAELIDSVEICVARNIHNRTQEDIEKLAREWEETPPHFTRLDVTALLSDSNIDEVEMECTGSGSEGEDEKEEEKNSESQTSWMRWECIARGSGSSPASQRRRRRRR
jgi:YLP motif-containing protein 1